MVLAGSVVEERDLIGALSEKVGLCPIDLDKVKVEEGTLEVLPQELARLYGVLPIAVIGNVLTLAVSDPFDVVNLDDVGIVTHCDLRPVVSTGPAIARAIERAYNRTENEITAILGTMTNEPEVELREDRDTNDNAEVDLADGAPVVKLVNLMVCEALKGRASDIHIEPFENKVNVRFRQDGILRQALSPPRALHAAMVSRIKIMAGLDIAERRKPQDGKFQLRIEGRKVDFRVSCLPTVHGEKVVMRILDTSNLGLNLDSLGFEEKALADFRSAVKAPYGMVLVTGPTGSGKSTTLYSAIREVMTPEKNIVTVEDPVEYELEDVNQVPVNPKAGLTFAGSLRSILRQDPDIVLVGEIRDQETAEIAVKAALTGHLVLSTLHTNDAPSTITRLVDMGIDAFLVASSTLVVSAQRLVRRLCKECKEPHEVPPERMLAAGFTDEEIEQAPALYGPHGCARCTNGYRGRFALLETMVMTDAVKRLILKEASSLEIKDQALKDGMITLRRCGLLNALRGKTSLEEVMNITNPD
ncbi:MAG: Flp pilus assembly complex ATPase component TadA [Coriobacteriia bacterium]|nr:Flp pilus assembly complex ATPase component TadA [Coriobacteriia bacterium]